MKKFIILFLISSFSLLFVGCGKDTIKLSGEEEIEIGQTLTLTVESSKENAIYNWESSDPKILTVTDGQICGISEGEVVVSVWLEDNQEVKAQMNITVKKSEGVEEMSQNIDSYFQNLFPSTASKRIILPYANELVIKQSIVYPDTIKRMRPGNGKNGQKMPGGVKYIVIHDTGMSDPKYDAAGINAYLHEQANSLDGRVASWHYTVGEKEIYQHVPDDEIAWHAGDGSAAYGTTHYSEEYKTWSIGGGNQNGIGIETCINQGGNYQLTIIRTAKLVATLLNKHNLGIESVKQHYDFSGKNCPAVIRSTTGRWDEFLKHVEFQLMLIKFEKDVSFKWEIDKLNVINIDGTVNHDLLNDEIVNINLLLEINKVESEYKYQVLVKGMDDETKLFNLYMSMRNTLIPSTLTSSVSLPLENKDYNATLTWSSSHPEILSNTGVYTKPPFATLVTLTVTLKTKDTTLTKSYKITIS